MSKAKHAGTEKAVGHLNLNLTLRDEKHNFNAQEVELYFRVDGQGELVWVFEVTKGLGTLPQTFKFSSKIKSANIKNGSFKIPDDLGITIEETIHGNVATYDADRGEVDFQFDEPNRTLSATFNCSAVSSRLNAEGDFKISEIYPFPFPPTKCVKN